MPKIIENLKQQLLSEAKRQISTSGYGATTIRSVASAVGVGVGTVYNYFSSKEMLIASFVLDDWNKYLEKMHRLPTDDAYTLLSGVYSALCDFITENEKLFSDTEAARDAVVGVGKRHKILLGQISDILLPLCLSRGLEMPQYYAEVLSELLISHSQKGAEFDTLYSILEKIIKK